MRPMMMMYQRFLLQQQRPLLNSQRKNLFKIFPNVNNKLKCFPFSTLNTNDNKKDTKKTQTLYDAIWQDAMNIPNALTMSRIVATPGICYLITTEYYNTAIVTFWFAGFFDWLDGHLARKWNQQSTLGSFLDPLADKIFVTGTVLTLTYSSLIPLPLGVLVIGRDLVLVGGSFYIRAKTKPAGAGFFDMGDAAGVKTVQASMVSKINTLFQFGLVWFTMTHVAWGLPPDFMMPWIWGLTGASTFASGFDYWYRGNQANIFLSQEKANQVNKDTKV